MKIIMDFRKYDGVVGGVEQGALQITRHVAGHGGQVLLVCKQHRLEQVRGLFGEVSGLTFVPLPVRSHLMSFANARIDTVVLQDLAEREKADLIHFYYNWSFPFRKKVPCLLTVHDVIPFTFREAMGFWRNRFVYRPSLRIACHLNNLITTVSEFSKRDIAKKVGVSPEKIRVIPNGLRTPHARDEKVLAELNARLGLGEHFVLNVGGIHERKNIIRLVHAFARLVRDTQYGGKLVITGSVSSQPYQEKMKALCDAAVAEARMQERVVFTGFVSEKELDQLFREADLLVYPSLYEGFGIPILEAMKLGTPVVTSTATVLPEVAGDAAVVTDPCDVGAMAGAMARVLGDAELRKTLREKGPERARHYSWEHTCGMYLALYQDMTSAGRAPG